MNNNLVFYANNADALVEQYDNALFESVHKSWLSYLPQKGTVLDIGAGSGRDARFFAKQGLAVYACEPVLPLLLKAKENATEHDITWYQDYLPLLTQTQALKKKFDLVLLSAVWMHLSPSERLVSMRNIACLLNAGGRLIITLRHGNFNDGRSAYSVSATEVSELAKANGLLVLLTTERVKDELGRNDIHWQTLVLEK